VVLDKHIFKAVEMNDLDDEHNEEFDHSHCDTLNKSDVFKSNLGKSYQSDLLDSICESQDVKK
jgi:hypothetical protein